MSLLTRVFRHPYLAVALLLGSTALAIVAANGEYTGEYHHFLHRHYDFDIGPIVLPNSLGHWINDGLMALFFLMVGLELKREFLIGALATRAKSLLPTLCAVGGFLVPVCIYMAINYDEPDHPRGLGHSCGHRHRLRAWPAGAGR